MQIDFISIFQKCDKHNPHLPTIRSRSPRNLEEEMEEEKYFPSTKGTDSWGSPSTVAYSPNPPLSPKVEVEKEEGEREGPPPSHVYGGGDDASSSLVSKASSLDVMECSPPEHPVDTAGKFGKKLICP